MADEQICIPSEHLFALLYVKRDLLPSGEGEGEEGEEPDLELVRLRADIASADRYKEPLDPDRALDPALADAYWDHAFGCNACRCLLIEDGPDARLPLTEDQVVKVQEDADEKRAALKVKFFIDLTIGTGFFFGAFATMQVINNKKFADNGETTLRAAGPAEIDPLYILFVALILVSSWFLAEAYSISRELWVDFTAWKRAVPVVGKAWADKSKNKAEAGKKTKNKVE